MKRLILAGGGHGHINILKKLIKSPMKDIDITLITDFGKQYYSGMLSGFIEGIYSEEEISFDVRELSKKANVNYVEEKIISIDKNKRIVTTDKNEYGYDFLSINLGSIANVNFPVDGSGVLNVKPISELVAAKENFFKQGFKDSRKRVYFIGGGASGVELAFSFKEAFKNFDITIITSGEILENFNESSRKKVRKLLNKKNINLVEGRFVTEIKNHTIVTENGNFDFDYVFLTSGFKGVDVKYIDFDVDERNYVTVDERLMVDESTFSMGDSANIKRYPKLPKAGVFAIREAPILLENLMSALKNTGDKKAYAPQLKYLQILNCGGKKAIMNYGNLSYYGKLSWWLKDRIDRKYMKV